MNISSNNAGPLCREILYENIFNNFQKYFNERNGLPLFISGIPGTGKSYTINFLISYLKNNDIYKKNVKIISFNCIELNNNEDIMEILIDKYREEYVKDENVNYNNCSKNDDKTRDRDKNSVFDKLSFRDIITSDNNNYYDSESNCLIIFIDEMDSLISKNEHIIVELCHLAYQSKIMIIGITNTISLSLSLSKDLVHGKIYPVFLNFPAYTSLETKLIIKNYVDMKASETNIIFENIGIDFITRKICVAGNGDIRNVLRICMKAYENALKNKNEMITIKQIKLLVLSEIKEIEDRELAYILEIPFKQQLILFCIYIMVKENNVTVGQKRKTIHSNDIMIKSIYLKYKILNKSKNIPNEDYNGFRIGIENLKNLNIITIKIKGKIEKVILNVDEDILYHNFKKIEFFQTMLML